MLLVYASRTGNIKRIVEKLDIENKKQIETGEEKINQEFILITYTDLLGDIPAIVKNFLKNNQYLLKGVAGSGNKNFGNNFCKSAKTISNKYNVPLLAEFDLSGDECNTTEFKNNLINLGCY